MRLKVSSAKRRPFCLDLNVLTQGELTQVCGWIHMNTLKIDVMF